MVTAVIMAMMAMMMAMMRAIITMMMKTNGTVGQLGIVMVCISKTESPSSTLTHEHIKIQKNVEN